ncbi:hypothetical protein EMQ25_13515 [Arsenicitalea aurantiaca]|uniref:Uncharacterized protein n=1 Tax=Arsenicitalea aurantiaca TaxID=1783274 RepID=A0A433X8E5_9HYPH|nr:hypothetical protein [Arsenicitalea aurantiaca]RUT30323.1 hypothetical protein EMQ25_13515 [Arsenicitalea aurantiaca]
MHEDRRERIASVIDQELQRQARTSATRLDVSAMADAVDTALGGASLAPGEADEGKTPAELNSSNDI